MAGAVDVCATATEVAITKAAAVAAIERHGVGAGASRLVTGNHPLYAELETRLARFRGTESACVFGSGYLANTGVAQALVGQDDLILIDELAHSSLWTGARLSRLEVDGVGVPVFRLGKGRPLLILHGFGDRAESWLVMAAMLHREYEVVLPDLPGFGFRPWRPSCWVRRFHSGAIRCCVTSEGCRGLMPRRCAPITVPAAR